MREADKQDLRLAGVGSLTFHADRVGRLSTAWPVEAGAIASLMAAQPAITSPDDDS